MCMKSMWVLAALLLQAGIANAAVTWASSAEATPAVAVPPDSQIADTLQSSVFNSILNDRDDASDSSPMDLPIDLSADPFTLYIPVTDDGAAWNTDGEVPIDGSGILWLPSTITDVTALAAESNMHTMQILEMPPLAQATTPPAVPLPPAFGVGLATFCISVCMVAKRRRSITHK